MMGSDIGNEGSGVRGQGLEDQGSTTDDRPPTTDDRTIRNPQSAIRNPESAGPPAQASSGWSRPEPEHLSEPTYWPAVMALGITMLLWGIVTSVIISIVGLALFALALTGWIGELLHENPEQ
jgi:hypothetical protein